jgi:regulator of sigma E protease
LEIIVFLIILTVVVLVHELGHFLFAKLFKVQILQFAIGFGPKLFGKKGRDGVEYRVNAFPLGGYVRMAGEDPTDTNHSEEEKKHYYYAKPAWQRFFIAFSGPLFSILFGYLFMSLTCVIWGIPTIGIDRVEPNSPAQMAGLLPGDILHSVDGQRIFSIDEFSSAVKKKEMFNVTIQRDGQLKSLQIKPEVFPQQTNFVIETTNPPLPLEGKSVLSINGAPLSVADLKSLTDQTVELMLDGGESVNMTLKAFTTLDSQKMIGIVYATVSRKLKDTVFPFENDDEILSINGEIIERSGDFYPILTLLAFPQVPDRYYTYLETKGESISSQFAMPSAKTVLVEVLRQDKKTELKMPYQDLTEALEKSMFYASYENSYPSNIFHAVGLGIQRTNIMLGRMGEIIGSLFVGKASVKDFSGPIGLVNIIGQATRAGMETLTFILAFITLNLGLINLLPLPALDGGRIVFNLIEMITRKRINPIVEGYIHTVGFFILIGFIVYISYFDIIRFIK